MRDLSSKEKATLTGVAQRIKPSINVGKNGVTDAFCSEMDRFLSVEKLVKVGFSVNREELSELESAIAKRCNCISVGGVGKKRSFFREAPDDES